MTLFWDGFDQAFPRNALAPISFISCQCRCSEVVTTASFIPANH